MSLTAAEMLMLLVVVVVVVVKGIFLNTILPQNSQFSITHYYKIKIKTCIITTTCNIYRNMIVKTYLFLICPLLLLQGNFCVEEVD